MFDTDYRGIGQNVNITMKGTGIVRGNDAGKPAKISANDTVTLAADGDAFIGVITTIEPDLTATLTPAGVFELPYTGAAPSLGAVNILCNGAGGIKADATGKLVTVLRVDTTASVAVFFKG